MISYGKKEIEALAFIEPINTNNLVIDTEKYIRNAHELRSEFLTDALRKMYRRTVGKYKEYRQLEAAKETLFAMTDRELKDIGITRSDIELAVEGRREMAMTTKTGFWRKLMNKFIEAQQARAAYVHLMAMDSRQLADIGLTRSEVEAAVNGNRNDRANDNLVRPSNTNDHRKAG
ncbi:DUF1127 domain-containing protein [uncultured Sneathiella sp.]|uniref:DUF1127 domain-containing protein n=1 Tax=uncultured Sneathiella sp. TaxID=879315 RepID=UPI0030EBE152|tara:strand:+ start:22982 stop:23506 length:525 start_codon:yes stop_codon:yes gene_type:complete